MLVPIANRRAHSLRTLTCHCCSKQFKANRRLDFCSAICRYADTTAVTQNTLIPAQEGAKSYDHDQTKD